jgi:hypothetical protein
LLQHKRTKLEGLKSKLLALLSTVQPFQIRISETNTLIYEMNIKDKESLFINLNIIKVENDDVELKKFLNSILNSVEVDLSVK